MSEVSTILFDERIGGYLLDTKLEILSLFVCILSYPATASIESLLLLKSRLAEVAIEAEAAIKKVTALR